MTNLLTAPHGTGPSRLDEEHIAFNRAAPTRRRPRASGLDAKTTPLLPLLVALDCLALATAWTLAIARFGSGEASFSQAAMQVGAGTIVSLLLARAEGLYRPNVGTVRNLEIAGVIRVTSRAALLALAVPLLAGNHPNLRVLGTGAALAFALMTMGRGLHTSWLRGERARGRFVQSVAVVAYREEADRLVNIVTHHPELGLQICAMASDGETAIRHGIPWLGQPNHALEGVLRSGATTALVSSAGMAPDEYNQVIQGLVRNGVHVQLSSGLRKVDHRRLQRVALANEAFFSLAPSGPTPIQLALKRAVDLIIASLVLVVSAPLVLAVAVAIKFQDRGPVFFRQIRVGHNGQLFTLLKFRTMVIDAEARLAELHSENQRHGPLFKVDSDPRVTRVGRLLRATSLDELPQLFNVLSGSMSLVGPRPALPTEVATFDDDLLRRHDVPPGITGLWQVEARENPSFEAYRHFDLFYVENWSCALDLVLLWATIPAVLTRAVRSMLRGREVVYGLSFNTQPVNSLDPQASTARDAMSVGA